MKDWIGRNSHTLELERLGGLGRTIFCTLVFFVFRFLCCTYCFLTLWTSQNLRDFIIFDTFWVSGALGNISTSTVSNSYFETRPVAREMSIFGSHFLPHVTENVNCCRFFKDAAARPSPGLILSLSLLPYGCEIRFCVPPTEKGTFLC